MKFKILINYNILKLYKYKNPLKQKKLRLIKWNKEIKDNENISQKNLKRKIKKTN